MLHASSTLCPRGRGLVVCNVRTTYGGGEINAKIRGKSESVYGMHVPIQARMRLLHDGKRTEKAARHGGMRYLDQGETAVLEVSCSNQRDPGFALLDIEQHPSFSAAQLTSAGIQPQRLQFIVVQGRGILCSLRAYRGYDQSSRHPRPNDSEPESVHVHASNPGSIRDCSAVSQQPSLGFVLRT